MAGEPLQNALAGQGQGARDLADGLASRIARQDLRPLDLADGSCPGLAKLIQAALLLNGQEELCAGGTSCHAPA